MLARTSVRGQTWLQIYLGTLVTQEIEVYPSARGLSLIKLSLSDKLILLLDLM